MAGGINNLFILMAAVPAQLVDRHSFIYLQEMLGYSIHFSRSAIRSAVVDIL